MHAGAFNLLFARTFTDGFVACAHARVTVSEKPLPMIARGMTNRVRSDAVPGMAAPRGRLAPWQRDRAVDLLRASIKEDISLVDVAGACRLSLSHFAHAFKKKLGQPPHKWLVEQRVALAKRLLLGSALAMVDVALESGFSDQSSFYRSFRRIAKTSPNQWRRNRGR
jgi:AraC family transcriptional regulator